MEITSHRKRPRSAVVSLAIFSWRIADVQHSCHAFSTVAGLSCRVNLKSLPVPVLHSPTTKVRHKTTNKKFLTEDDADSWQAGDVYRDLELLEQGIRLANADANLMQTERLDLLRHMALSRRPLLPDVRRYVLLPLLVTSLLRRFYAPLANILLRVSNLQFWTTTVLAPMSLLVAKRLTKPPPEPMPKELQGLALEYISLSTATEWEAPEKSCRDAVLVVLEYWTSAVAVMALVGVVRMIAAMKNYSIPSLMGWMGVVQLVTRLAAVAAIHQNPEQLYQIQRTTQPQPLTFFSSIMQPLVSSIMLFLPLGLAMDFFIVLGPMPNEAVTAVYMTLLLGGVGTWMRLKEQEQRDQEEGGVPQLRAMKARTRWLYGVASLIIARDPMDRMLNRRGLGWPIIIEWMQQPFGETWPLFRRGLYRAVLWTCTGIAASAIPVLHLRSLARLVRVVYTHDASLAMDPSDFAQVAQDEARNVWRYRLEWQENPQRIGQVFNKWKSNLVYWLFFEGRAQDRLIQEQKSQSHASSMDWNLKDRILRDIEKGLSGVPRDQWKRKAMETLAEKHQADFDRKSFDDPLGVAVQQTLGIGLGFNFDHDQPLDKGQRPSLRRLQARAAKSAIRRVQQLYDPQRARNELDEVSDLEKRNAVATEMRMRAEEEIKFLAERMTELLPPPSDTSDEFKDRTVVKRFQQRKEPSGWVRVNSHEYRPFFDDSDGAVKSVEQDITDFESEAKDGDVLAEMNVHSATQGKRKDTSMSNSNDDEFVQAFLEQKQANVPDVDEDDDNTQILLT